MEQLTIKQLLDLGADIDIYFHNCESKEDAETKVRSLGIDVKMGRFFHKPTKKRHGFHSYGTVGITPVKATAFYGYKEKLK